jgi:hypothetical protein
VTLSRNFCVDRHSSRLAHSRRRLRRPVGSMLLVRQTGPETHHSLNAGHHLDTLQPLLFRLTSPLAHPLPRKSTSVDGTLPLPPPPPRTCSALKTPNPPHPSLGRSCTTSPRASEPAGSCGCGSPSNQTRPQTRLPLSRPQRDCSIC